MNAGRLTGNTGHRRVIEQSGTGMTRTERLLRLARLRGDRLAIATLEGPCARSRSHVVGAFATASTVIVTALTTGTVRCSAVATEAEAELRAAWGDR